MLSDKSFEDYLNSIKRGEEPPITNHQENSWIQPVVSEEGNPAPPSPNLSLDKWNPWKEIGSNLGRLFSVILISILYGYGVSAIFNVEWTELQTTGIGFLLYHTTSYLKSILSKLFNR